MGETIWFFVKCALYTATVLAILALVSGCAVAQQTQEEDPLVGIGVACYQGNTNACLIYQAVTQDRQAAAFRQLQALSSINQWAQNYQALQMQQQQYNYRPIVPFTCTKMGVFTQCQ